MGGIGEECFQHIGLRRSREKGTADGVSERWRECRCGKQMNEEMEGVLTQRIRD